MDLTDDFGSNMIERQPVQSPAKLRRELSTQETDDIKGLIRHLRYDRGKDDSYFLTLAQAAQLEGKKIIKMGALNKKK